MLAIGVQYAHALILTLAGLKVNQRSKVVNPMDASLPISF